MILERGDMWSAFELADVFCITTNAIVNSRGELVMGRGMAQQAAERIPGLAAVAGACLRRTGMVGKCYGLLNITPAGQKRPLVAAFQTKRHWRWASDLVVISVAARQLQEAARKREDWRWDLNFPGIGYGNLQRGEVLHILEDLPDNCHIWECDASCPSPSSSH